MGRLWTASVLWIVASACSESAAPQGGASGGAGGSDPNREGLVPIVTDCEVPAVPADTEIDLSVDVEYAQIGAETLLLDVAAPLNAAASPLVVMIHGGGWISGDKADERPRNVIVRLAALGYVAASVNYRLALNGDNIFPAAVEDVRCAVRWLQAHADAYGADPSRTAVIGSSAGGHLALMVGTAGDVEGLDGSCPLSGTIDVAGAVSFYGPTDLRPGSPWGVGTSLLPSFLGDAPENVPELAALASPIAHVDSHDRPQLLVHGGGDSLVLPEQGRAMQAAFEGAGVASTYLELPSAPHGFDVLTEDEVFRSSTCTALAYLAAVLGVPGSP